MQPISIKIYLFAVDHLTKFFRNAPQLLSKVNQYGKKGVTPIKLQEKIVQIEFYCQNFHTIIYLYLHPCICFTSPCYCMNVFTCNLLDINIKTFDLSSANGDVIVTLLPQNTSLPWITPAQFRPELVPEELMAQGLTVCGAHVFS